LSLWNNGGVEKRQRGGGLPQRGQLKRLLIRGHESKPGSKCHDPCLNDTCIEAMQGTKCTDSTLQTTLNIRKITKFSPLVMNDRDDPIIIKQMAQEGLPRGIGGQWSQTLVQEGAGCQGYLARQAVTPPVHRNAPATFLAYQAAGLWVFHWIHREEIQVVVDVVEIVVEVIVHAIRKFVRLFKSAPEIPEF